MGLRSSKHSPKSYDVATVPSNNDFTYKRPPKPLPEVTLPAVVVTADDGHEVAEVDETVQVNGKARVADVEVFESNEQVSTENIKTETDQIQKFEATSIALEVTAEATTPLKEAQDSKIPSWVNEDNFKPVLMKLFPDFKEIVAFKAYPALAAGENYATLMLRVKITIKLQDDTTKDLSYMLKVAHDGMMEMLQHMNFFVTENSTYNDVIPGLEDMYREAGVNVEFGARSYQLAEEAPKAYYVLLDDLSLRGFKNVNRLECLDMEHTLAVLRKLAQFHAATACHVATKGNYIDEVFSPSMDNEMARGMMKQMFGSFKKPFMDNLPTFENGEKYADLMDKFFDNIIEAFIHGRTPRPGYFNVLNHGDAWSNNILFNYTADGKLDEVLFVDFQNTNYGSPAQDIFYFLISSTQVDIKVKQFDFFIRHYHKHLVESLQLLKYTGEIPKLRELHMQLIEYGAWATVTSFMTMGVVLLDPTDSAKFENFMSDSKEGLDFKNAVYSNPRYLTHINEVLPWLYHRGFMEINNDLDNAADSTDNSIKPATNNVNNEVASNFSYPEWVNESYFSDIIRSDYENYQKIIKLDVSPATSAGDNYSSIMLKVDITIELSDNSNRNVSYMLKIPPAGEQAIAIINHLASFPKEICGYNEIIPQFEKVFKDQAGIEVIFGPRSYKSTIDNGCETLILENLKTKGFSNCDRLQGLDMDHTKAVLKKLAEFHAASAYVYATKGRFPKMYETSIYNEAFRTAQKESMDEFQNIYLSCVQQYNGSEEYIDNVKQYLANSFDCLAKCHSFDDGKFNVLNHGDCWTNNIMFQYDDKGTITNTYFVDFQLMRYGSPAADLYYLLLTSSKLELKLEQFDYFIRYYHEHLKTSLELLKYPKEIPTLKELHVELLEQGTWAMHASMVPMAAMLMDPTENASLEQMMKSDDSGVDFKRNMFSSKRYRTHAEAILPWITRRGLLAVDFELTKSSSPANDFKPIKVPSWVDAEHFEDILKQDYDNFGRITGITTCPATKPGDNYASSLLRIKVDVVLTDGTTQTKSYILKLPLESEYENDMVSDWNFFDKEILMYSKYVKEFEALYAQNGQDVVFGPKFYTFDKNVGKDLFLMEDLSKSGFSCGDRREGLNMAHCKCVLSKLAKFHAASAKYVEINGRYPEEFHKGIYTEETRHFFENMKLDFFNDYVKTFDNHAEYMDKIPNLLDNFVDYGIRVNTVDPSEFNVLNHGDTWLNNIMFKYIESDGAIEQTYFIDYQVCQYGSPALDLWYFIMSSCELALKTEQFDYFVRYYHQHLMENLNRLQFAGNVPTLSEFHQTMLKYGYKGFDTFFGVGAVCLSAPNENANMTNFAADTLEGRLFRDALFANEKYKAHAAVVLPWLARRGCLD